MKLVVFDLEMNQPSTSIIQIGAVSVDTVTRQINPLFNQIANPGEIISDYISNLTGIQQSDVQKAESLKTTLKKFWDSIPQIHTTLGAWGNDTQKIIRESKNLGIQPPNKYKVDLQEVADKYRSLSDDAPTTTGLMKFVKFFGIDFEGYHHNAYHDARMTAKILFKILDDLF